MCFLSLSFPQTVIMLVQVMAAKLWTTWELMTAHLIQNEENVKKGEDDSFSLVCSLCITVFLYNSLYCIL